MSKTDTAEATEVAPVKSKKKKKKLVMLIVLVLLVIGAGAGGYFMLMGGSADAAKEAPEKGAVIALEPVTINLADGHYLKLAFALQATADAHAEPDGSRALDLAISHYTDMKVAELSSAKGREHAKAELIEKVKKSYEHEVMDIYFTQFVTQ